MPTLEQQLEEARKKALGIQESLGTLQEKGFGKVDIADIPQGIDISQLEPIKGENLTPTTPPDTPKPESTPTTDISTLETTPPKEKLTEQEKKEVGLEEELAKITEKLAEKPAFEAKKRREFQVRAEQQAVDDLNTRIKDLQRQQKLVPEVLELESLGRGRTVGGVMPLKIGRRRAIAVEALTTASLLDAAQGRLTSARRKVEEAVNEKFAPLLARQDAIITQLGIIERSPETSRQERERAAARKKQEEAEQERIQELKDEQKAILDWATKATTALAEAGKLSPQMNVKIKEIQESGSEIEAAQKYSDIVAGLPVDEEFVSGDFGLLQRFLGREPTQEEFLDFKRKQAIAKKIPTGKTGEDGEDVAFLNSILQEPSLFNVLTKSEKTKLLPTLVSQGFQPLKDLSDKVITGFASFDDVRGMINRLDQLLAEGTRTGPLSALRGVGQRLIGTESSQQLSFKNISEDLFRTILKATSGVAASEREVSRLKSFLPKFTAQEATNIQNIKDFKKTLIEVQFNALKRWNAAKFDISGQLEIFDDQLNELLAGVDLESLSENVEEGEGLVINRKTGEIQAITAEEFDPILHLIIQ